MCARDFFPCWLTVTLGLVLAEVQLRRFWAKSWQLRFLPAYSPDFSPIEETFSKLKTGLRRRKARTREALEEAIAQELLTVTSQDAHGWFEHCGYVCSEQMMS